MLANNMTALQEAVRVDSDTAVVVTRNIAENRAERGFDADSVFRRCPKSESSGEPTKKPCHGREGVAEKNEDGGADYATGMVTPAGFEPAISTLKGSRPGPD
jgi:hypothetical protein